VGEALGPPQKNNNYYSLSAFIKCVDTDCPALIRDFSSSPSLMTVAPGLRWPCGNPVLFQAAVRGVLASLEKLIFCYIFRNAMPWDRCRPKRL
jgi:hypothetical protein